MTWRVGLFVHWPFDPEAVRPHVPDRLELDTHHGTAWISVLPFVLANAGLRYSPSAVRLSFPEVNVRTYVLFDGVPGLYFFSIDVGNPLLARFVRATTRLPCHPADAQVRRSGEIVFRSTRIDASNTDGESDGQFSVSYRPSGEPFHAEPGSLEYWLMERRRMYDPVGRGVLYSEIAHEPWPLQRAEATIHRNALFQANQLPVPDADPILRYSETVSMTGSIPRVLNT